MNAVLLKEKLIEKLKGYRNIVVSGPQRTGTTLAGFEISRMLGVKYYTEEAFGVHDKKLFFQLLQTRGQKVIQCPALSHTLDEIADKEDTIIVWMVRPIEAIVKSQERISWSEEGIEKAKYIERINDLFQIGDLADLDFRDPISKIKYQFWEKHQRAVIPHFLEIEYADLATIFPDSWIAAKDRKTFNSRQIAPTRETGFISDSLYICQLFFDYGSGFSEEFSVFHTLQEGENEVRVDLVVPTDKKLSAIRLDPTNEPLVIDIQSIELTPNGSHLFIDSDNSQFKEGNRYYFNHNDPQLILRNLKEEPITEEELLIRFDVVHIGTAAVRKLYYDHQDRLRHEIKQAESAVLAIKRENETYSHLKEELRAYKSAQHAALATLAEKDAIQKKLEAQLDHLKITHEVEVYCLNQEHRSSLSMIRAKNEALRTEVEKLESQVISLDAQLSSVQIDIQEKAQTMLYAQEQLVAEKAESEQATQKLQETITKQKEELTWQFQRKLDVIKRDLNAATDHSKKLERESEDLRYSLSFKIGWALTSPIRWTYETVYKKMILGQSPKPQTPRITTPREARQEMPAAVPEIQNAPESANLVTLPERYEHPFISSGMLQDLLKFQNPGTDFQADLTKELKLNSDPILKLIAFYLPQFHSIPENDHVWGKGFTEWTNVTKGIPRFSGHYQPRLPADFGFYNLSQKETIKRQVELAKKAGLFGFCFHFYWFSGHRLLEKPLELFLADQSIDFNFCLCWANENWTKRWDGLDQEVIIKQDFSPNDTSALIEDLKPYLRDQRYIYLEGRPLIIIYRPQLIPNIKETAASWRQLLLESGFGNPILCAVQGFGLNDPEEVGFDAVVEFPPHKLAENKENRSAEYHIYDDNFQGIIIPYEDIVASAVSEKEHSFPIFRGVFPSWDNEARKKGKGATYHGSTPEKFEKWLDFASDYALNHPVNDNSLVFINAWNEWAEGAYLEPDQHFGYRYLNSVQAISERFNCPPKNKYIVVSHDAHLHGAQLNVLALAKTLKRQFGLEITILLLASGALESAFEQVAPTINIKQYLAADRGGLLQLLKKIKQDGYQYALVNTTVSNNILPELEAAGIISLSLIHELPNLIREYGLEQEVKYIAEKADQVVFPNRIVENGFRSFEPEIKGNVRTRPQGVYAFDLFSIDSIKAGQLRKRLGLGAKDIIIANLGFGDMRKGVDLFVQIADFVTQRNSNCHFVWIGNLQAVVEPWIKHDIEKLTYKANVHLIPFHDQIAEYIRDIDIFALSSREDPFPSVVLECLAMGAACVVFAGSGGIVELNDQFPGLLSVVPYVDTTAMSEVILDLAADRERRAQLAKYSKKVMQDHFNYDDYSFFLTQGFDPDLQKISVIVPNYNYAHTLKERLQSIWDQDYPIFELIILDDCSTDNSIEEIRKLADSYQRVVRIVENESNSGSPFLQWQKGVNIARGNLIWIAEADDSAEPGFLSAMVPFFTDNALGLAYSQSKQIDENGVLLANDYRYYTDDLSEDKWRNNYVIDGQREIIEGLAIKNTILNVSSVVWRVDLLKKLMNEHIKEIRKFKVAGDWFLYVKALQQAKLGFCAQPLNIHRRHSSSVTHKLNNDRHLKEIQAVQRMVQEFDFFPESLADSQRAYFSSVKSALQRK